MGRTAGSKNKPFEVLTNMGCSTLPDCALRRRWADEREIINAEIIRSYQAGGHIREIDAVHVVDYLRGQIKQWRAGVNVGSGKHMHLAAAIEPIVARLESAARLVESGERDVLTIGRALR